MQQADERPAMTTQEEASANLSNLNTVINPSKQHPNGHINVTPNENRQILLLASQQQQQQQQQQLEQIVNANRNQTSRELKHDTSQTQGVPATLSSNNVADYVMPAGNSLIQPATGLVHVPVMAQEHDNDINVSYDDIRDKDELREQDRFLPIANVARIMKRAIPETGKIAKDAKECVQECVSEFISFITSEASDRCHQEKRKTINGEDILFAMTTLGFDSYVEPLKLYLTKYRESVKGDKVLNLANEYGQVDMEDSDNSIQHNTLQYQVGNSIHPSMVSSDGTYAFTQAQVTQLQNMHFNG